MLGMSFDSNYEKASIMQTVFLVSMLLIFVMLMLLDILLVVVSIFGQ